MADIQELKRNAESMRDKIGPHVCAFTAIQVLDLIAQLKQAKEDKRKLALQLLTEEGQERGDYWPMSRGLSAMNVE